MADHTTTQIARWLRETRLRQRMTGTDGEQRPWTYQHLLARMKEEVGWAPAHPNYSKYENGLQTPKPSTLKKLIAFWAKHGEPGPALSPPTQETPPAGIPELVAALAAQTDAINKLVARLGSLADESIASAVRQAVAEAGLDLGDGDSPAAPPPAPSL